MTNNEEEIGMIETEDYFERLEEVEQLMKNKFKKDKGKDE